MAELAVGTQVRFTNGGSCTVKKELGRGGQGIVYLVDYNGKDYALKWYIVPYSDAFYANLEKNAKAGSPSPSFLWPEAVTVRQNDSYGYLMKLRPSGYEEIGAFMLAKVRFESIDALLEAALEICTSFQLLHIRGLSYQDMNDGNFFINPKTGHVLICDNDNVAPNGVNMGIAGKTGFMAPEIVEGESRPNIYTDYFSLAVTLFILFYLNRPFEGAFTLACPCMNEAADKRINGKNEVFIMDPSDASNRPVKGVHVNVLRRWGAFPDVLQEEFIKTFSREAILNPQKRTMPRKWQEIIVQVRSMFVECPVCSKKTFVNGVTPCKCMECGRLLAKPFIIKSGKYRIPLVPGQRLYSCQVTLDNDYSKVEGEVIRNRIDPKKWGLRNQSAQIWTVTLPDGVTIKNVGPGEGMPAVAGAKIRFSKDVVGEIEQ